MNCFDLCLLARVYVFSLTHTHTHTHTLQIAVDSESAEGMFQRFDIFRKKAVREDIAAKSAFARFDTFIKSNDH